MRHWGHTQSTEQIAEQAAPNLVARREVIRMTELLSSPILQSPTSKPRDVQVLPIAPETTALRSRSWKRLRFEIEYALERGTTANSFLIQADRIAIVDPPGETFTEIYLAELQRRLDLTRLDYVILGHVNPNRIATLKVLLKLAQQATIVCSNPAAIALRAAFAASAEPNSDLDQPADSQPTTPQTLAVNALDAPKGISNKVANIPNIIVARGDDSLDLGMGHQLQFIPTPNPRYPDSLCTYDPKSNILYTDKLFGAHICGDQVFDEGWSVWLDDRRYYFDCLMAPHARHVETALEKLASAVPQFADLSRSPEQKTTATPQLAYTGGQSLASFFIAPGHGPLVKYGLGDLVRTYGEWSQQQRSREITVALLYASAYGNTTTLGQAIARGITKAGVAVESINCEAAEPAEIQAAIEKASGFVIGTPTLGGHVPTPVQTALGIVLSTASKTKLAGVFGSFGWSGEAIDIVQGKLRDAGYTFGFEPIRVKFKPTEATLQLCEQTGTDFAQSLKKARKVRTASQPASSVEQAVGRLVGSLCIVTARHGEVSGAMLASWVSQATFNPPGVMVAVAKDRAIESLMHPGDRFVLNVLAEGKHIPLMKHFLKPFQPGEDRFASVATQNTPSGNVVLAEALAWLECRVEQRMECGDHWLVYAVAEAGNVLLADALTAVHHRKTGVKY